MKMAWKRNMLNLLHQHSHTHTLLVSSLAPAQICTPRPSVGPIRCAAQSEEEEQWPLTSLSCATWDCQVKLNYYVCIIMDHFLRFGHENEKAIASLFSF